MGTRATLSACALLALSLLASGCSAFGRPFDESHASDVRVGLRQSVIVAWFGEPIAKVTLVRQKCSERWLWLYGRQGIGAATHSLSVKFDGKGMVCAP